MATLKNRIKQLVQEAKQKSVQPQESFRITEELYSKLDFVQQASLPKTVKVEFNLSEEYKSLTDAFFNDEISYREYEKRVDEISDYEEINDEDFQQCIDKYGGLGYNWTEERLEELRKGKVPTE